MLRRTLLSLSAAAATPASPAGASGFHLGSVTYQLLQDWDLDTLLTHLEASGFAGVELRMCLRIDSSLLSLGESLATRALRLACDRSKNLSAFRKLHGDGWGLLTTTSMCFSQKLKTNIRERNSLSRRNPDEF
jgi:hypothetical protein